MIRYRVKWLCAVVMGVAVSTTAHGVMVSIAVQENGETVPCRIHLTDAAGEPVKTDAYPWWHDHFVCPGTAKLDLPSGTYAYEIERGPEYVPATGRIAVDADPVTVAATLERRADMQAGGWWPGDLHVHRKVEDVELLMQAEDLHIAPVITWWNKRNVWRGGNLPEDVLVSFDGDRFYHVMGGEDEREGGGFLILNRDEPLAIGFADREWPSPMQFLESAAGERGTWIDIEKPFWWDVPLALAFGYCDTLGLANNHMCRSGMYESEAWGKPRDTDRLPPPRGNGFFTQETYYRVLEAGLRIPPSAGSASGVLPNPVGYDRVYVHLDGELTYEKWFSGLKAGRSFVTNGPMLVVTANGALPGHVFQSPNAVTVDLAIELTTVDPITHVEIVHNGEVSRTISVEDVANGGIGGLQFDESGWFLVRAITDVQHTFRFASTAPFYVEAGDTPERISASAVQYFLDWVRERRDRVKHGDPAKLAEVIAWHDRAEAYWMQRLEDANAE